MFLILLLLTISVKRSCSVKSHYKVLGVRSRASSEEIRKAYRSLAKKLHPDRNPTDPKAADRFRRLASAYEILSDPKKRAEYDDELRNPHHQSFSDFNQHAAQYQQPHGSRRYVRIYKNGQFYQVPLDDFGHFGHGEFSNNGGWHGRRQHDEQHDHSWLFNAQLILLLMLAGLVALTLTGTTTQPQDDMNTSSKQQQEEPVMVTAESSIKELLNEARRRGLDTRGCPEKTDLFRLLGLPIPLGGSS